MRQFCAWLFTDEHLFTLVTVVLSGLISWVISAAYFRKGNRQLHIDADMVVLAAAIEPDKSARPLATMLTASMDNN